MDLDHTKKHCNRKSFKLRKKIERLLKGKEWSCKKFTTKKDKYGRINQKRSKII